MNEHALESYIRFYEHSYFLFILLDKYENIYFSNPCRERISVNMGQGFDKIVYLGIVVPRTTDNYDKNIKKLNEMEEMIQLKEKTILENQNSVVADRYGKSLFYIKISDFWKKDLARFDLFTLILRSLFLSKINNDSPFDILEKEPLCDKCLAAIKYFFQGNVNFAKNTINITPVNDKNGFVSVFSNINENELAKYLTK